MNALPTGRVMAALARAVAPGALPPMPAWDESAGRVARTWGLSAFEVDLLLIVALPEAHDGWGNTFASLGSASRRPTIGLALRLLVPDPEQYARTAGALSQGTLFARGLVRMSSFDLPRPDRPLRVSTPTLAALEGIVPERLEGSGPVRAGDATGGALSLEVFPRLRKLVEALARSGERRGGATVHVPTREGEQARQLAEALASRLARGVLWVADVPGTAAAIEDVLALAAMREDVVVAELLADARRVTLPAAPLKGWILWVSGPDAVIDAPPGTELRIAVPPTPVPSEQAELWGRLLPAGSRVKLDLLANQTRLDARAIRRAVSLAASLADARGAEALGHEDVVGALAELRRDPPPAFASVRHPRVPWSSLLVPPAVRTRLDALRVRVEHRVTVQYRWGMASSSGRGDGVVALLHGESGTGKTHAAEALATALGLSLVMIDLSRVVSKYIGETEKNLASLFADAEGFASLLFFDEADAVFGKRTSVGDAHDRYANIETNFLLQRLESFEGIALLSTNLLQNLDDAFLRRLQFVIHLPRPTPGVRRSLWEQLLPTGVRAPDLDLAEAAMRFDLVGGEIRNAALASAYAAAAAGTLVTPELLVDAIRDELAKKGRPLPHR